MIDFRLIIQLALGVTFLISTTGKLTDPYGFARGVQEYKLTSPGLAYSIGLLVIPIELVLAASHLTGWALALAAPLGLILITIFLLAVGTVLATRDQDVPCYCFGATSGETVSARTLSRLSLMLTGEILLLTDPALFTSSRLVYPEQIANASDAGVAVCCTIALLVIVMWIVSLDWIVALLRPVTHMSGGSNSTLRRTEKE